MRVVIKEHLVEALVGVVVVALAVWFFAFAYGRTGGGVRHGGYHVSALFNNASGVSVGTDVRVAGMTVGRVVSSALDPQTWQARLTFALDPGVKLPADSSAAITSEGIMGGNYIAIMPGGDTASLKDGDQIIDTQSSVDLMGLIGQFVNQTGSVGKEEGAAKDHGAGAAGGEGVIAGDHGSTATGAAPAQ